MIKNENYITIQGFMVNELNLKGNDLIIYAIIYGFTQDGQNWFEGNRQYLADWCNGSTRGIANNLQSLVEKELIIKEDVVINNIKFCKYRVNLEKIQVYTQSFTTHEKSSYPMKKVPTPHEKSSPNNIININIIEEGEEEKIEKLQKILIETLGNTNIYTINECITYLNELPLEVIEYALQITARKNAKWNYAKTILNDYVKNNLNSIDKIKAEELNFKSKKETNDEQKIKDNAKAMAERLRKRMGLNNED